MEEKYNNNIDIAYKINSEKEFNFIKMEIKKLHIKITEFNLINSFISFIDIKTGKQYNVKFNPNNAHIINIVANVIYDYKKKNGITIRELLNETIQRFNNNYNSWIAEIDIFISQTMSSSIERVTLINIKWEPLNKLRNKKIKKILK